MVKKVLIVLVLVVGAGIAWWLISPVWRVVPRNDTLPVVPAKSQKGAGVVPDIKQVVQGDFQPKAHDVKGNASVPETESGKILRFENFETINGPDLRIYLSADLEAKDFIDLGPIKGTQGNINYFLPANVDLNRYNKVLVWCRAFHVLFSYAELR